MPTRSPDTPSSDRAGERIAKLLARAGVASRREVERMIADGRVARDGVAIDTPATVLTSLHGVTVDGHPVAAPEPTRLFVYHKPVGQLVTEHDPAGRPTIYDRLPEELPRVVPVGRLDLATEGLLLLTTDGGLKRQLELPATGVERTYRARAYGPVTQAQLEELIHGVEIEGMRYGAIDANLERRTGANGWIEMTLTEGKNREVRRVLDYLGLEVSRLIRTRYGPFELGDLKPGEVGEIGQHDLEAFRKTLKVGAGKDRETMEAVVAQPLAKGREARPAPTSPPPRRRAPMAGSDAAQPARQGRPAPAKPNAGSREQRPSGSDDRTPAAERRGGATPNARSAARAARHRDDVRDRRDQDDRSTPRSPDQRVDRRADRSAKSAKRPARPAAGNTASTQRSDTRRTTPARPPGDRPARTGPSGRGKPTGPGRPTGPRGKR